jgi:hypothetical protein
MSLEQIAASLIGITLRCQNDSVKTRKTSALLLTVGLAVLWMLGTVAAAQTPPGIGAVMTYNVNEGSDFLQVQSANSVGDFLVGVGEIVQQVQDTNPSERMKAVAQQILAIRPPLVSLQEVDQWYTGSFDPIASSCGPMALQFDMLQDLLAALAAGGGHYQVAVKVIQYAFPPTPGLIPPSTYICAAVNNYNVVLTRTDLPATIFNWTNPQSGQFTNILTLPTPVGPIPLPRSWASLDAQFFGHTFRFIDTHFESFSAVLREAQGGELRAGPANTSLPIVLAMDSNSQAFPLPQDGTYLDFLANGYSDVWSEIFPSLPGFTCCQSEADNNSVSTLSERIDLILTKGPVAPLGITLLDADPRSRLTDGLWPSDHAAVAAAVVVREK